MDADVQGWRCCICDDGTGMNESDLIHNRQDVQLRRTREFV